MASSDDEPLDLSSAAMAALQDFYTERDQLAGQFDQLKVEAEKGREKMKEVEKKWTMDCFPENWNISQFWYSDKTAACFARQLLSGTTSDSIVVVISTPTVFVQLKNMVSSFAPEVPKPRLVLLEHDARFDVFGDEFVWYDFNNPLKVPADLKGKADRIMLDPPFLSEECQTKCALTVRLLARPSTSSSTPTTITSSTISSNNTNSAVDAITTSPSQTRIIVCTGERMEPLLTEKLYKPVQVRTTSYEIVHAKLSNEFKCFANFDCDEWEWVDA